MTLPAILKLATGRSPIAYARGLTTALVTAFSTASSNGTLPLTMREVEEAGVKPEVTSFVLPLGATVNMDGTALYEVVAVLFIAQVYGVDPHDRPTRPRRGDRPTREHRSRRHPPTPAWS